MGNELNRVKFDELEDGEFAIILKLPRLVNTLTKML